MAKILLADESRLVVTMLSSILKSGGHEVITASNGFDALNAFYNEQPELALLNICMPDISGYITCRIIKENTERPSIPVMLLTGKEDQVSRFWGENARADHYLVKDNYDPQQFLNLIESLLAKENIEQRQAKSYSPSQILSNVCEMFANKLDKLVIHERISLLAQEKDNNQALYSLFELLSNIIEYNIGLLYMQEQNILYRYANFANDPAMQKEMTRQLQVNEQANPVHLKEATVENNEAMKSYFLFPLEYQGKPLAKLMLGSYNDNIAEESVLGMLDSIMANIALVIENLRSYHVG